jgi:hypothetical protein
VLALREADEGYEDAGASKTKSWMDGRRLDELEADSFLRIEPKTCDAPRERELVCAWAWGVRYSTLLPSSTAPSVDVDASQWVLNVWEAVRFMAPSKLGSAVLSSAADEVLGRGRMAMDGFRCMGGGGLGDIQQEAPEPWTAAVTRGTLWASGAVRPGCGEEKLLGETGLRDGASHVVSVGARLW